MPADLSSSKVSKGEQPSSTKFDDFVQAAQDDVNAIGDGTKSGFAPLLWLDPAKIKQNAATSGQMLAWNGSAWAPTAAPNPAVFVVISDQLLGAPSAVIDFQSIPGTYKHLFIGGYARGTQASTLLHMQLRINNDSANSYDYYTTVCNGTTPTFVGAEGFTQSSILAISCLPGANAPANLYASFEALIPHYAGTTKDKVISGLAGAKIATTTGGLYANRFEGFWRSTAAITRVTVAASSGNLDTGTRIFLAGIA